MNINYVIRLWKNSNFDYIIIKSLPLARLDDRVVVMPTLILKKDQKILIGKEVNAYEYLIELFDNSIFEYIEDNERLIIKEIYRR